MNRDLNFYLYNLKKPLIFAYIVLVLLLSLATYHEGLGFDLRGEDWYALWIVIQPDLKDVVFQTLLFRDHPILTYQELILAPLFKFNAFYWYLFGYALKVLGAFAVGLLVRGITRSKKAAIYSSLIFAASVIGLETYLMVTVQSPALIIIPMCLSLYFWIASRRERSLKKYLISVIFFTMVFMGDPGRGISVIAMGFFWDLLELIKEKSRKVFIQVIIRNFILIIVLSLLYWLTGFAANQFNNGGHPANLKGGLVYITEQPVSAMNNFMVAIGNLLVGWIIPIYESDSMAAMSYPHKASLVSSYLFLFILIFLLGKFIKQRTGFHQISSFFAVWVIFSFFPTWILLQWYVGGLLPGVSGKYLFISSVGFISLVGYLLSRIKLRYGILFLFIFIAFNITTANRILKQSWGHRSVFIHNMFWDEVDKVIPKDQNNIIIMFTGTTHLASELAATYSIPLGLRRGINNAEELPITTGDRELVKRLLCQEGVYRPNFLVYGPGRFGPILQKEKIPLSRLYAWKINEDTFINVTKEERKLLKNEVRCKLD